MMDDETTETGAAPSSRREFIRNSAIATGAVWAAPAIMSVGPRALGSEGSEDGDCPPEGLLVFKYDVSDPEKGTPAKFTIDASMNPYDVHGCGYPGSEAEVAQAIQNNPSKLSIVNGDLYIHNQKVMVTETTNATTGKVQATFVIPAACELRGVSAKSGQSCSEQLVQSGNTFTVYDIKTAGEDKDHDLSNVSVLICCTPAD